MAVVFVPTDSIGGYSNLTPLGFGSKTLKGSNVSNTVSYAVKELAEKKHDNDSDYNLMP
jgi:hypothetical protein